MPNLLLIESPGKSKKLSQILGNGWIVKASLGHVRELADDGEDALGFDLAGDRVECRYEARSGRAKKVLAELRQAVKQADRVYIATDPDREGETIGWHLQQELRLKNPQRVVYSEITPQAVQRAIANPRSLDQALIGAGRARDCLDKLVGYRGSKHLVWKLKNGARSMGRVQSATLHLLCQREKEILSFQPQDYWSVWVEYREGFKAFYCKRLTPPKQAAAEPGDDASEEKATPEGDRVLSQAEADRLVAIARSQPHHVVKVERKLTRQSPPPPFITATLQQAAVAKLRLSPDQTMRIAQTLYEAGHITYMRTDSVTLAAPFCAAVQQYLTQHDPTNLPKQATRHRSSQKAQEAHEAIRPTDVFQTPQQLQSRVSPEAARLYELIWNRAVASQCAAVEIAKTRIVTQSGDLYWEARGQGVVVPGYTRYWNNLSAEVQLPTVTEGQGVHLQQAAADAKQTQPPPRYTEPKLVQLMERKGVGRPSTYAPTVKTLKDREYVQLVKGKLQPTPLGMELDGFLEMVLPDLIQPEFTAQMESALDVIASGQQDWQTYLTEWNQTYFAPALALAIQKVREFESSRPPSDQPPTPPSRETAQPSSAFPPRQRSTRGRKAATPQSSSPAQKSSRGSKPAVPAQSPNAIACPKCDRPMTRIASNSPKLKADHFLACDRQQGGCGAVLFWNPQSKGYELPYNQRVPDPEALTDIPCPVCGAFLERYTYMREGQSKVMLRCTIPENRKGKCQDVAFFQGRDGFWSPKFGVLKQKSPF
ncbi:MAG: type I DNA topoisomerase [Leptolyngbyaceae cyanobacterium bins.59]|nr:type I DNA topoisomerase [Leptolyngbyaceae cyanobacterium bins.59]